MELVFNSGATDLNIEFSFSTPVPDSQLCICPITDASPYIGDADLGTHGILLWYYCYHIPGLYLKVLETYGIVFKVTEIALI